MGPVIVNHFRNVIHREGLAKGNLVVAASLQYNPYLLYPFPPPPILPLAIDEGRCQCVSESYQNYQNGAVNNQLTEGGRGVGEWLGVSVNLLIV